MFTFVLNSAYPCSSRMLVRSLTQTLGSRTGARKQQMLPESKETTSESLVKKNFSIDFSISVLKHRPFAAAEPLQVKAVDHFVIPTLTGPIW